MTNFTTEMNYNDLKVKAKELGMANPTGKSKEMLVEFINNQLQGGNTMTTENQTTQAEVTTETTPRAPKAPKKTLADFGLTENEVITIAGFDVQGKGHILAGRKAKVTKVSRAEGRVKAFLLNEKTNEFQNTEINIPVDAIIKDEPTTEEVTEEVAV